MNICIIGYGYVGSEITNYLLKHTDYNLTIITNNINLNEITNSRIQFIKCHYQSMSSDFYLMFDTIILACGVNSPYESNTMTESIFKEVVSYTYLIDILKHNQKLIYMSSGAVYGDNLESSETDILYINNMYDLGKVCRDNINYQSNKLIFGLRLGTLSGTLSNKKVKRNSILNNVILDSKLNNNITVNKKNINRAILGPRDLGRVINIIIEKGNIENKGVYNINSFNITIDDLLKNIYKYYPDCKVNYKKFNTSYNFRLDNSLFCKEFDFEFIDGFDYIYNTLITTDINTQVIKKAYPKCITSYKCKCCNNIMVELLNLGYQPLANNYHTYLDYPDYYPLVSLYCKNCFHVQLSCTVDPNILFSNYLYVSGTSKTGLNYFREFSKKTFNENTKYILDIACNDGSQLDTFKELNNKCITVGVDPAENLYSISSKKGHDIYIGFFESICDNILEKYPRFDIIIAQNVFAHVDKPREFLEKCKLFMDDNSDLYIQTSQANMIINGEFDTIYHEHISFFNTNSMRVLCDTVGLFLYRVEIVGIHGGSYLFHIKLNEQFDNNYNVSDMLLTEISNRLYDDVIYNEYRLKCQLYRAEFESTILRSQLNGYDIIGFGSTAKFNTVLNYTFHNKNSPISYIIDENILKCGLLTPGCNIPIRNIDSLKTITEHTLIIISAWNFSKEIKGKIIKYLKDNDFPIGFSIKFMNVNPISIEHIILY